MSIIKLAVRFCLLFAIEPASLSLCWNESRKAEMSRVAGLRSDKTKHAAGGSLLLWSKSWTELTSSAWLTIKLNPDKERSEWKTSLRLRDLPFGKVRF